MRAGSEPLFCLSLIISIHKMRCNASRESVCVRVGS